MGAEIERIQETVADRQRGFVPDLRSEVFLLPNETQRRAQRVKMNLESFAKFTELVNDSAGSPFSCHLHVLADEHIPRGKIASKL